MAEFQYRKKVWGGDWPARFKKPREHEGERE